MPLVEEEPARKHGYTVHRACYRGVFTLDQAQAKLDAAAPGKLTAIEVRPAQCLSADETSNELVVATEVLFLEAPFGGAVP